MKTKGTCREGSVHFKLDGVESSLLSLGRLRKQGYSAHRVTQQNCSVIYCDEKIENEPFGNQTAAVHFHSPPLFRLLLDPTLYLYNNPNEKFSRRILVTIHKIHFY
jgi:hypothetical protein